MINNYAKGTLNLRSTYLLESINESFRENNIPYTILDNEDESVIWNIYHSYDRRTYNDDERFPVKENYYTNGFHYYVILEYIDDPSNFAQKKVWFILRGHNYYPGRPYLENYRGKMLWDSTEYSYEDIIKIIHKLDKQTTDEYQFEYDEYMKHKDEYDSYDDNYDEN